MPIHVAPKGNGRRGGGARVRAGSEKRYADLTSRVTFVGRCTFRHIARVHLHSVPSADRSIVHTRTGAARTREERGRGGEGGGEERRRAESIAGGYRSLIGRPFALSDEVRGRIRLKESTSALRSLPPFLTEEDSSRVSSSSLYELPIAGF